VSGCKFNNERGDYLTDDGEPCKRDSYGDPTHHCQARRTCSQHVAANEQTCARCVARTRQNIRFIREWSALLQVAALADGVNSQAANLAGPAAEVESWSWRKITAKQGGPWHLSLIEDDDDWHPFTVLTRWHWMISGAYRHQLPEVLTIVNSAEYLERHLNKIAQDASDEGPDFREMAGELRKCRNNIELVLHDSSRGLHGAPCPECVATGKVNPRSVLLLCIFSHYCEDEACEQVHYEGDTGDIWVCPRNRDHWMTAQGYRNYAAERTG
jgi:hypothetical protein